MFSQRSFAFIDQLSPPRPVIEDSHSSPFEEEDEFDFEDPKFHSYSRKNSIVEETDLGSRGQTSVSVSDGSAKDSRVEVSSRSLTILSTVIGPLPYVLCGQTLLCLTKRA